MTSKKPQHISRPLWATDAIREPEIEKMSSGVPLQCQFCVGQSFRRSRLRAGDLPQLLLMRYPVRCARCSQRQTVSFTVAAVSNLPRHSTPLPGAARWQANEVPSERVFRLKAPPNRKDRPDHIMTSDGSVPDSHHGGSLWTSEVSRPLVDTSQLKACTRAYSSCAVPPKV